MRMRETERVGKKEKARKNVSSHERTKQVKIQQQRGNYMKLSKKKATMAKNCLRIRKKTKQRLAKDRKRRAGFKIIR